MTGWEDKYVEAVIERVSLYLIDSNGLGYSKRVIVQWLGKKPLPI